MDDTPAPVSLAAARALRPPEGSRAAEVFRDDHVWIRFAARPPPAPRRRMIATNFTSLHRAPRAIAGTAAKP